jgi:cytochrome P450 family 6
MLVVALLVVVLALAYYYFTSTFSYWKNKNVKFIKPYPLVGSMGRVMAIKEHLLEFNTRIYRDNEGESYVGYFQCRTPVLLVRDPELVKHVLVKDFSHFTDHGMQVTTNIPTPNLLRL